MIFREYSPNDTRIPNVIQGIFPNSGILGFLGILRHKQTPTLPAESQKLGVYGLWFIGLRIHNPLRRKARRRL